jgi:hypothetical protein
MYATSDRIILLESATLGLPMRYVSTPRLRSLQYQQDLDTIFLAVFVLTLLTP